MHKNAPAGKYRPARRNPLSDCPLTAAFAAVGGKWKLTIIYWIARERSHFASLQRRATPISHKVLAEQLRELEADGIVERIPLGAVPAPVEYRLTGYGGTVLPVVESVRIWGESHLQRMRGSDPASMACEVPLGIATDTHETAPARDQL